MADTKITSLLTPQVTTNPATDVLPIVNIADTSMASSGSTRKITVNTLLGSGGTATLASATITGDLTVRTNKLAVTNTGVGIGTASPAEALHVSNGNIRMSINQFLYLYYGSATNYASLGADNSGNVQIFTGLSSPANRFQIANDGVATWSNVGGTSGTAMTLNSTGLGVGVASPSYKLDVAGAANSAPITLLRLNNTGTTGGGPGIASRLQFNAGATALGFVQGCNFASGSIGVQISGDGTNIHQTIDSFGNVGIGNTPSAWISGSPAVQLKYNSSIWAFTDNSIQVNQNAFYDGAWKYINAASLEATNYFQNAGKHIWRSAGTGTAPNLINWNTQMTLDASGNLLVGTTSGLYRGQFAVAAGADRNIFTAQVTSASNGLQVQWNHATTTLRVVLSNIPTSAAGLAAGTLWNDAGTIKIA